MTQAVHVRWIGIGGIYQLVVVIILGELPMLDLVDRRAANLGRPILPRIVIEPSRLRG